MSSPPPDTCIGVFDSGVGGLSVLRALQRRLPQAQLLYAADSGHAPYGEREPAFIVERSRALTTHLLRQGASLIVIACNTATAVAAQALRDDHPACPIVGVEPGLKPALALTRNGRIGVMATRGTLESEKFRRLVDSLPMLYPPQLQPCPGLAQALEGGDADQPEVLALIARHTAALRAAEVDTVVLGCTHYPFATTQIQAALGSDVTLVDTAEAVARRVESLLPAAGSPMGTARPGRAWGTARPARLWTSGPAPELQRIAARWLDFPTEVQPLPLATA